ncbi:MAG: choice-of-anchor tandem repeat GloVer-containing protein, partial [Capsulimonadaceae bacterium]
MANDGIYPMGGLVLATDGNFYGTTWRGGSASGGTVFQVTPSGVLTILHSFGDGTVANDGASPVNAGLIQGLDGYLYGTTEVGGVAWCGTVYRISTSGAVTILHSFCDGSVPSDGVNPLAGLVQGTDGNLYGTTIEGGLVGLGTAFRITTAGVETVLHSFGYTANDGFLPCAPLLQASDGNFYGTTWFGGSNGWASSTAFRMTAAGSVTILHTFGSGTVAFDGAEGYEAPGLIQATDGNLYGTTSSGGFNGSGTAFRLTVSGSETILHAFDDGSVSNDGVEPGVMMEALDGSLYGVSAEGGGYNSGTFFRIGLTPAYPAAPTGLTATAGNAQIELSWTASTGATSYDVYRSTTSGSEGSTPIGTATSEAYTDTGLTNGVNYFYTVAAVNDGGTSPPSTEASATPEAPVLSAPTALTATAGDAQVSLSWTGSAGATSYNVYRATTSGDEGSTAIGTTAGTTYTNSGLTNGVTYFYKVAAVNASQTSVQSGEASATPEPPIPAAPTGLTATTGDTQVSLSWTASSGATSYNIYRATTSGGEGSTAIGTALATTYTDTGLTNGVTCYYKVAAVNGGGISGQSGEAFATPEPSIPSAPTGLTATAGALQIALTWTASVGATSYNVYRGTVSGGEGLAAIGTTTGTTYTDSGVTNGVTYFYKVAAINAGGTSAKSGEAQATPEPPPAAPTNLAATGELGGVSLTWTASVNASTYSVFMGTSSGAEGSTPVQTGTTTTHAFVGSLASGTTYYFTVAAANGAGSSSQSGEASAMTDLAAPTGLSAVNGNGWVQLTWNPSTGATSYNVYQGTAEFQCNTGVRSVTSTSATVTGLTNGSVYFFAVTAVDALGESAQSEESVATPSSYDTAPPVPTGLVATSSSGAMLLNWSAAASATSYEIYVGTSAGGEDAAPVMSSSATTALVTGLTNLETYYFEVAGVNSYGTGALSNEASNQPISEAPLYLFGSGESPNGPYTDGAEPTDLIQATDGTFYGLTAEGGTASEGTLFQLDPLGNETILHTFGDGTVANDGSVPCGLILANDGNFYGTTTYGGSTTGTDPTGYGYGTVFRMTPDGVVTILHSFGDGSVANDAAKPKAGLVQATDGNFYGTSLAGGSAGVGTVFRVTPSGGVTILHSFGDGSVENDGTQPIATLIQGTDGKLYGTTEAGGAAGYGTAFSMSISGGETVLHSFADGSVPSDGSEPWAPLLQASDGDFYGTTVAGGLAFDQGTVYRMDSFGNVTILHSFGDGTVEFDGMNPEAGLVQGSDGNFYGATYLANFTSAYNFNGSAFRIDAAGNMSILHVFGDGSVTEDGGSPDSMIQGIDGSLYGTNTFGQYFDIPNRGGTIFKIVDGLNPPAPTPTDLTATAGNTSVTLNWIGANGAASYKVYEGTSAGAEGSTPVQTGITATTTTVTGLSSETTYFFMVTALVAGTESAPTNEASATPLPQIPAVPTGLTATPGDTQVSLSWSSSSGATSYYVYRGTATGGESATPVGTATGTTYTDTGLTNGVAYYYKVAAVNGGGTSAESSEASATPEPPIPSVPTSLTATPGNTQVSLSWSSSSGATSFNVYRGTASGSEGSTPVGTASGTTYTDTGLTNGVAYYYKVAAVNGGGTSAESSEASATPEPPIPPVPTGLAATPGNTQVSLSWSSSSGATS